MILDRELDKLRNKELSFGCVVSVGHQEQIDSFAAGYHDQYDRYTESQFQYIDGDLFYSTRNGVEDATGWNRDLTHIDVNSKKCEITGIVGYPLTRGRINYLYDTNNSIEGIRPAFDNIVVLMSINGLFDQNELQRMTHAKWPELKELLIQFQNILYPSDTPC